MGKKVELVEGPNGPRLRKPGEWEARVVSCGHMCCWDWADGRCCDCPESAGSACCKVCQTRRELRNEESEIEPRPGRRRLEGGPEARYPKSKRPPRNACRLPAEDAGRRGARTVPEYPGRERTDRRGGSRDHQAGRGRRRRARVHGGVPHRGMRPGVHVPRAGLYATALLRAEVSQVQEALRSRGRGRAATRGSETQEQEPWLVGGRLSRTAPQPLSMSASRELHGFLFAFCSAASFASIHSSKASSKKALTTSSARQSRRSR